MVEEDNRNFPSLIGEAASNKETTNPMGFQVKNYGSTDVSDTSTNQTRSTESDTGTDEVQDVTFLALLKQNRPFRLYMISYMITHTGEWLTYIASIALIEEMLVTSGSSSRTAISILVMVRLLPSVLFCPIGGILADGWDRRVSMIILDILGAISSILFLSALYIKSIQVVYLVTILQQCIAGLYEPCRSSIVPLLVPEEEYLKKAITIAGLSWSVFAAFGSSLGGILLTLLGFRACFDACSYLASAYMMYLVKGKYHIAAISEEEVDSLWGLFKNMTVEGVKYLRASFFGALVLLKATVGMMYGAADVLNVSFSEPNGVADEHSPARLGLIFAFMGIGCTLGPLIADRHTDMKRPVSLQKACISGLAISTLGFFGIAFVSPFWATCAFTLIRTGGGSTNWIDSSILLQKFASDEMMGRVLAVDYALALLAEAFSAFLAGYLQDSLSMTAHQAALAISCLASLLVLCWVAYHLDGRGAGAEPAGKQDDSTRTQATEGTAPLV